MNTKQHQDKAKMVEIITIACTNLKSEFPVSEEAKKFIEIGLNWLKEIPEDTFKT